MSPNQPNTNLVLANILRLYEDTGHPVSIEAAKLLVDFQKLAPANQKTVRDITRFMVPKSH